MRTLSGIGGRRRPTTTSIRRAKSFLGTTNPASAATDAEGNLKVALDTLFNHPNTGPFIGRPLIQRLVTSNPSPA
jgi:uncharacterized protein (DUF1800 family)